MNRPSSLPSFIIGAIVAASGIQILDAQLPSIDEAPWLGYFAAFSGSRYQLGISSMGDLHLKPVASGNAIANAYLVKIEPTLVETQASGKTVTKRLIAESLETTDLATDQLEKVTYHGEVAGGATLEVTVEQTRGIILVGGRLLEVGKLKNPLRFVVSVKIPNLYRSERKPRADASEREKRREEKTFADKLRGDRLMLKWTDDQSLRHSLSDSVDAASEGINGPGIADLELQSAPFRGRKLMLNASPGTAMTLSNSNSNSNSKSAPLYQGFEVSWAPDPAKDPDGKARLALGFR